MAIVLGAVAFGIVLLIAALAVLRESRRLSAMPPRPTFDVGDALDWVVHNLSDEAAATLTVDEVRQILDFQLEFFRAQGITGNTGNGAGVGSPQARPVVVGGPELVGYIIERAGHAGVDFTSDQVHAVIETQLAYLRAIGAVGSRADEDDL
ncbi:MAG: hypothetical protein ACRDY7_01675 [Acidimicrobiia bacterium]